MQKDGLLDLGHHFVGRYVVDVEQRFAVDASRYAGSVKVFSVADSISARTRRSLTLRRRHASWTEITKAVPSSELFFYFFLCQPGRFSDVHGIDLPQPDLRVGLHGGQ